MGILLLDVLCIDRMPSSVVEKLMSIKSKNPTLASLGTGSLFFFIIAAAAPLTSITGFAPLAFMIGGGWLSQLYMPACPRGGLLHFYKRWAWTAYWAWFFLGRLCVLYPRTDRLLCCCWLVHPRGSQRVLRLCTFLGRMRLGRDGSLRLLDFTAYL